MAAETARASMGAIVHSTDHVRARGGESGRARRPWDRTRASLIYAVGRVWPGGLPVVPEPLDGVPDPDRGRVVGGPGGVDHEGSVMSGRYPPTGSHATATPRP